MGKNLGVFDSPKVSDKISVNNNRTHNFKIVATGVSGSVLVRIESSINNQDYANVTDYDYEIAADGTYNLIITPNHVASSLRFRFVSGTGDLQVNYLNY